MRKYQELWNKLKQDKSVVVSLPKVSFTEQQKEKQLRTIRKAITKEKYNDHHYKIEYPNSELTSTLNVKRGTLTLELTDDTTDVSHLF